jgi:hypothetical protein
VEDIVAGTVTASSQVGLQFRTYPPVKELEEFAFIIMREESFYYALSLLRSEEWFNLIPFYTDDFQVTLKRGVCQEDLEESAVAFKCL